ncbi:MAG: 3'(2'),5'-bisphosphate nucleotidase CysQ [Myxococcota bacterium]
MTGHGAATTGRAAGRTGHGGSGVDLEQEVSVARAAAAAAGEGIARLASGARESWDKAEDSPVTLADLEANRRILDTLREAFPDDAILSEETADVRSRLSAERVWIVDPLDGTKEFIAGIPEFAVSIALALRGEPVVGVVLQPLTRECFFAAQGRGAWLGEERLRVSPLAVLADCQVLSSRSEMKRGQLDPYESWFREIRPVGSVALKLALIAAGRGDLWISAAPKSEWDVCAGDLLVREAGGRFETLAEGPRRYNQAQVLLQPMMLAGSPALLQAFRERADS